MTDHDFWNNAEATAERIVDGVKTGDVGRLLDRADDMVISGGFNIHPAELENVTAAHFDLVEVAVFGIVDERWGEVCVKGEAAVTEKELVELCAVHLGNRKRPGKICCFAIHCPRRRSARSSARANR